jgi:hypothetical protein
MAKFKNYFYSLIFGAIFSVLFSLFARYGIELTLYIYKVWSIGVGIALIVVYLAIVCAGASSAGSSIPSSDHQEGTTKRTEVVVNKTFDFFLLFACIFGILIISCIIPALIIYWLTNPLNLKRAIKIAVFLLSMGGSIICFIKYREKFPTVVEKSLFFLGVFGGLVSMVDMIF